MIGVTAPGSPVREEFLAPGIALLGEMGFRVRRSPHLMARTRYTAGSASDRAGDVQALLSDPEVRALWFARGGYGSPHLPSPPATRNAADGSQVADRGVRRHGAAPVGAPRRRGRRSRTDARVELRPATTSTRPSSSGSSRFPSPSARCRPRRSSRSTAVAQAAASPAAACRSSSPPSAPPGRSRPTAASSSSRTSPPSPTRSTACSPSSVRRASSPPSAACSSARCSTAGR